MQSFVLLAVAAVWLAVIVPPLLRSRVENRPNSSVTDFRRQLSTLQRAVPTRTMVPMRGMARQLLESIGVEVSAGAVARHYGSRRDGGVLDGWLVDTVDAEHVEAVEAAGITCRAVPLMMTDHAATAAMAVAAVDLAP